LAAALTGLVMTGATSRRAAPGAGRSAWICLSIALTLYLIGLTSGAGSWLMHREPFPGPADFVFCAFCPAIAATALYQMRAATLRVSWMQLSMDALIFVAGFGA